MGQSFVTKLTAGILVGTLDITAACIQYFIKTGKGPANVLKFVASGVFGKEAFTGGEQMIYWGLLFHYMIAISFAFFFFLIAPVLQSITNNRILTGIAYGIFTWAISTQVIVRFSNTPKSDFNITGALVAAAILIICIGIPLAYIAAAPAKK